RGPPFNKARRENYPFPNSFSHVRLRTTETLSRRRDTIMKCIYQIKTITNNMAGILLLSLLTTPALMRAQHNRLQNNSQPAVPSRPAPIVSTPEPSENRPAPPEHRPAPPEHRPAPPEHRPAAPEHRQAGEEVTPRVRTPE